MTMEEAKAFVERWREAGPVLARVRREELRGYQYENHMDEIDSLLELGAQFAKPRPTSGLVEQQRLFQKARP